MTGGRSAGPPLPAADELHVWRLEVAAAPVRALLPLLDAQERARAERLAFEHLRDEFVAVRGSLRRLIGAYLGRDPAAVRFRYGAQGKPAIADDAPVLTFNVSHSAGRALLAFGPAPGIGIGVDVEAIRDQRDLRDLARTSFSPVEFDAFAAVAPASRTRYFYRLWTAKEAYIKGLGGGLSIPLQEFTIDVRDPEGPWPVRTRNSRAEPWVVRPVEVSAAHAGAVAMPAGHSRLSVFDLTGA